MLINSGFYENFKLALFWGHPRYGEIPKFGIVEKTLGPLQIFCLLCSNAHRKAKSYPLAFDRGVGQENWTRT